MKTNMMSLCDLHVGQSAIVEKVGGEGMLRKHLLDMGLTSGTVVTKTGSAPSSDPIEIRTRGYNLTIRKSEAAGICVSECDLPEAVEETADDFGYNLSLHEHNSHPGLGEDGKYHSKEDEKPLPKDTVLTFALAGQQNSGKTTLFNALTGFGAHVGNFPGVTTERMDAPVRNHPDTLVTDLPGTYSLSPYTSDESVAREFLLSERPKGIINIVDAGNIERNLYLTVQLMQLGIPMVVALNMMDEARSNGVNIRINELERILGVPVVPISAARNEGVDELVRHAIHVARYQELPQKTDFCDRESYGGSVHRCIHSIMHIVEDHAEKAGIPVRFAAEKVVEGDGSVTESLCLDRDDMAAIESLIGRMEAERGMDRYEAMADMRFSFIAKLCAATVKKHGKSRSAARTGRLDRILTGKWTAVPIFITIICLILYLTIDVIGAPLQEALSFLIGNAGAAVGDWLESLGVAPAVCSLFEDAIFGGVGAVLSFVPIILVLFSFLSILEDSGYMARVAYVTDSLLRKIGLSGRSIIPLLIGLGCSVPGVMAARTLPSARDRKKTILLMPFMSCSAKLPIYAFISSAFFPGKGGVVLICLYLLSILTGALIAVIQKKLFSRSEASPFVMELPVYRIPGLSNVGHLIWDKTKDFLQMAFTVIFFATIAIWFLRSFDFDLRMVEDGRNSILASIAGLVAPVLSPLGLGDWRIVTALISGFLAKESIVSTLGILGGLELLDTAAAVSLLVFCLLYTPCVAAIASIKRELGGKWAAFVVVFQCIVAWVMAFAAYSIAGIIV